jgi:hypothetical protein
VAFFSVANFLFAYSLPLATRPYVPNIRPLCALSRAVSQILQEGGQGKGRGATLILPGHKRRKRTPAGRRPRRGRTEGVMAVSLIGSLPSIVKLHTYRDGGIGHGAGTPANLSGRNGHILKSLSNYPSTRPFPFSRAMVPLQKNILSRLLDKRYILDYIL